jgi:hypothetical protein
MAFGPLKYSSMTAATGLTEEGIFLVVTFSNADADAPLSSNCLSINTIFTLMESGVEVIVAMADGVKVGVLLGMIVGEEVADGVNDFVAAGTLVFVDIVDGVNVGVLEGATVEVLTDVEVNVR